MEVINYNKGIMLWNGLVRFAKWEDNRFSLAIKKRNYLIIKYLLKNVNIKYKFKIYIIKKYKKVKFWVH